VIHPLGASVLLNLVALSLLDLALVEENGDVLCPWLSAITGDTIVEGLVS